MTDEKPRVRYVTDERTKSYERVTVTDEPYDPRSRFGLYRLCDCTTCEGRGKVGEFGAGPTRCWTCRGEGKVRQEVASCESPEAVGVALVTLGREQEWQDCAFGLLDREGEKGQKWLILPWLPSPRNVSDAGKLLRSRRKPATPPENPSNLTR